MNPINCALIVFCLAFSFLCNAQEYHAVCKIDGETYENASISLGFTNFGTEDEPEYAFCIFGMTGVSDEVDHMLFFSQRAMWDFNSVRPFLNNNDSVVIKDVYSIWSSGRQAESVQIGVYGANVNGSFAPKYILLTIYASQGIPKCNYWIDYSVEIKNEIFNVIKDAIKNLDIPHVQ